MTKISENIVFVDSSPDEQRFDSVVLNYMSELGCYEEEWMIDTQYTPEENREQVKKMAAIRKAEAKCFSCL